MRLHRSLLATAFLASFVISGYGLSKRAYSQPLYCFASNIYEAFSPSGPTFNAAMQTYTYSVMWDLTWDCGIGTVSACKICIIEEVWKSSDGPDGPYDVANATAKSYVATAPACNTGNFQSISDSFPMLAKNSFYKIVYLVRPANSLSDDCRNIDDYNDATDTVGTFKFGTGNGL